jgi:AraC family cel operon transcriptional repressor
MRGAGFHSTSLEDLPPKFLPKADVLLWYIDILETKRWRQLVAPGVWHHLAVIVFGPDRPSLLHTHDFPEIFWVERGEGRHEINGVTRKLRAGDLIFMRPEDSHRLAASDRFGFVMVNLAYSPRMRKDLLARHPRALKPLLQPTGPLPCRVEVSPAVLVTLRHQAMRLGPEESARMDLEYFLLGLQQQVRRVVGTGAAPTPMPDWLYRACEEVQRPEVFAQGTAGFGRASGRSAEHVARTVRAVFGITPSAYINRIRMEHAARELRVTSRPIVEIALDCGLSNLSHFYALFRAAHRNTPRAYRLSHNRPVI